jgi:hypothetical protein
VATPPLRGPEVATGTKTGHQRWLLVLELVEHHHLELVLHLKLALHLGKVAVTVLMPEKFGALEIELTNLTAPCRRHVGYGAHLQPLAVEARQGEAILHVLMAAVGDANHQSNGISACTKQRRRDVKQSPLVSRHITFRVAESLRG